VTLTPLDDASVESSETVVLELSSPSSNAQLGAFASYTHTIDDDAHHDVGLVVRT
jgi:hypothetical protein